MEEFWTGTLGEERTAFAMPVFTVCPLRSSEVIYFFFDEESDSSCSRPAQLFKCATARLLVDLQTGAS